MKWTDKKGLKELKKFLIEKEIERGACLCDDKKYYRVMGLPYGGNKEVGLECFAPFPEFVSLEKLMGLKRQRKDDIKLDCIQELDTEKVVSNIDMLLQLKIGTVFECKDGYFVVLFLEDYTKNPFYDKDHKITGILLKDLKDFTSLTLDSITTYNYVLLLKTFSLSGKKLKKEVVEIVRTKVRMLCQ